MTIYATRPGVWDASVPIEPASALIGGASPFQWLAAAAPLLGGVAGGAPAGPSRADSSGYTQSPLDGSGWTVATGSARATSTPQLPWPWILGAAVIGLLIWKRA